MHHRLVRLTTCSFSLAFLLAACGGKTFESDADSSGVQGAGGDGNSVSDDPSVSDDGEPGTDDGSSASTDDANGDDSSDGDPGDTPTSDEPGGGSEPEPTAEPGAMPPPGGGRCPETCPVMAICKLCDDGSCGSPETSCNSDGSCGKTTFVCPEDDAPPDPGDPTDPVDPADYQPCLDKSCGDECDACAPGLQCLIGAGYCNAEGSCLPLEPECGGEPAQCQCPVTDVCMICEGDGSCAQAVAQCDTQGQCTGTQWACPDEPVAECKTEKDCASLEGCLQCKNGEEWCPHSVCRKGECATSPNLCPESYEPCAGKEEGEACQNCSPLDPACSETDEIKSCQAGSCQSSAAR